MVKKYIVSKYLKYMMMTTEDNGKDDGGWKEMCGEALVEEKATTLVSDLPANAH